MLTLGDRPSTTGRCSFLDADGIRDEPKIYIPVIPGDWQTPALAPLDTGAAWSVLDTEIAEDLGLFNELGEHTNLSTRLGSMEGIFHAKLVPQLKERFAGALDEQSEWSLEIDPANSEKVVLVYPAVSLEQDATPDSYIRREVLLELGVRSDHWPARAHKVQPYAAEEFPSEFRQPAVTVKTLDAERTFWEKITILHAMFHHSSPNTFRASRHYYAFA